MERTIYRELPLNRSVWGMAILLAAFVLGGLASVIYVEHHGHIVTGMNNQIVWGLPHVFAIFLIVAASGALNVASMASVFGKTAYKPLSRLSGVMAIALLAGGLAVLVLDLGRPDRLLVAMTTFNFTSIFTWNVFLYTGFMGIVAVYLWVQMDRNVHPKWTKPAGLFAFLWRLALTTGTGSIFGWLVARPGYDAAVMGPLFIVMSFSFGLAVFAFLLIVMFRMSERELSNALVARMMKLLGIFIGLVLYFTLVQHLTAMYAAEHSGFVRFLLMEGGTITGLFWVGQIALGSVIPLFLIYGGGEIYIGRAVTISLLVILGGFIQLYVIIVGGQAYPMEIYPGFEVTSGFFEAELTSYSPRWPEWLLGLSGVALAVMATGIGAKILRILPTKLSDAG